MSDAITPRPQLAQMPGAAHGAFDFAELERLGLAPDDVIDFSVNANPYGPSPAVREALHAVPLDRYPDRDCLALRRALSAHLGVPPGRILAGSGIAELLWLLALAYVRPGDKCLILAPTFGEYTQVVQMMGGLVKTYTAPAAEQFVPDVTAVARELEREAWRLVFICNPNNPTGQLLPAAQIRAWAAAHPQTLFVVDEAYLAFAPAAETAVAPHPNLLVLRSMTKDYALAGLRLGYAVGMPPLVDALRQVQPPWSVNALAQAAGVAALGEQVYLRRTLAQLQRDKEMLVAGLTALGYAPLPSATHFFLVKVGETAVLRQKLLRRGVQVRDCASFGLPGYIRIASRREAENGRLLAALAEVRR